MKNGESTAKTVIFLVFKLVINKKTSFQACTLKNSLGCQSTLRTNTLKVYADTHMSARMLLDHMAIHVATHTWRRDNHMATTW